MRQQFKVLANRAKRSGRLQEVALFDEAGDPLSLTGGNEPEIGNVTAAPWTFVAEDQASSESLFADAFTKVIQWTPTRTGRVSFLPLLPKPAGTYYTAITVWAGTVEGVDFPSRSSAAGSGLTAVANDVNYGWFEAGTTYTVVVLVYWSDTPEAVIGETCDLTPLAQALAPLGDVSASVDRSLLFTAVGDLIKVNLDLHSSGSLLGSDSPLAGIALRPGDLRQEFVLQDVDIVGAGGHVGPSYVVDQTFEVPGYVAVFSYIDYQVVRADGAASFVVTGFYSQIDNAAEGAYNMGASIFNGFEAGWDSPAVTGTDLTRDGSANRVVSAAGGELVVTLKGRVTIVSEFDGFLG